MQTARTDKEEEDRSALSNTLRHRLGVFFSFLSIGDYIFLVWGVAAPLAFVFITVLKLSLPIHGKHLVYSAVALLAFFGVFWIFFGIDRTDPKRCLGEVFSKTPIYGFVMTSPYGTSARIEYSKLGIQCYFPEFVTIHITKDPYKVRELSVDNNVKVVYRAESLPGQMKPTLIVESINNIQFWKNNKIVSYLGPLLIALFPSAYLVFTGIRDRRKRLPFKM